MSAIVMMVLFAADAEALFREAVALQQQEKKSREAFKAAIAAYEEMRTAGASNAGLYRNLLPALRHSFPPAMAQCNVRCSVGSCLYHLLKRLLDDAPFLDIHEPEGKAPAGPRNTWEFRPLEFVAATSVELLAVLQALSKESDIDPFSERVSVPYLVL